MINFSLAGKISFFFFKRKDMKKNQDGFTLTVK